MLSDPPAPHTAAPITAAEADTVRPKFSYLRRFCNMTSTSHSTPVTRYVRIRCLCPQPNTAKADPPGAPSLHLSGIVLYFLGKRERVQIASSCYMQDRPEQPP